MKATVIIPNYRHAPYLRERIDSVLNQTYPDFEVIILDDCSPDDSREVIETYRGAPHISRIIYNETNSGSTFRQWRKGFELAQGECIWIAESDDYADPHFLERCMEQFELHPDCVLAYTESRLVNAAGEPLPRELKQAVHTDRPCDLWDGEEFVRRNMLIHNVVYNASMAVFRKSAIPADERYTQFRMNGDWLFWCEVARRGRVAHINSRLNCFRQHERKVTVETLRDGSALIEIARLYRILFEIVPLRTSTRRAVIGKISRRVLRAVKKLSPETRRAVLDVWRREYGNLFLARAWYEIYKILHLQPPFHL